MKSDAMFQPRKITPHATAITAATMMSTTLQRNRDDAAPVLGGAVVDAAVFVTVVPFSSERARVSRGLPALA
jgi:hypothetical protein